METFGQRLARLREGHGWTQQELAARSGVPYMTIYRLEAGIYDDTRTAIAAKLSKALGVSLDVLTGIYDKGNGEAATADGALQGASAVADVALVQEATLGASVTQEEGEEVYATPRDERGTPVARTA